MIGHNVASSEAEQRPLRMAPLRFVELDVGKLINVADERCRRPYLDLAKQYDDLPTSLDVLKSEGELGSDQPTSFTCLAICCTLVRTQDLRIADDEIESMVANDQGNSFPAVYGLFQFCQTFLMLDCAMFRDFAHVRRCFERDRGL